ncbi:hypothetical protein C1646_725726, partial [Rhizophagus diaphanus]
SFLSSSIPSLLFASITPLHLLITPFRLPSLLFIYHHAIFLLFVSYHFSLLFFTPLHLLLLSISSLL